MSVRPTVPKEVVDRAAVARLRESFRERAEACERAAHVLHLVGGHTKAIKDLYVASKMYHVLGNEIGTDLLDEVPF